MASVSNHGEFTTGNFALTTSLVTCGFGWADEKQKLRNLYEDPERPERFGKSQRLRKFGKVTFFISRTNSTDPSVSLDMALKAYDGEIDPGADLDALLAGDGTVDKKVVRELLHLSYIQCAKNTCANLKTIREMPHFVPSHIKFTKNDGLPMVISENCDAETAAEWGITKT